MNKTKSKGRWLRAAGLLLLAAALALTVYNIWDERRAGQAVQQTLAALPAPAAPVQLDAAAGPDAQVLPDYQLAPDMEMPAVAVDGERYIGVIEVPALGLQLPVLRAWSYDNLKIAPCRYAGSAYTGNLVLAAHNYSTHFGRLDELSPGDAVRFTDVDGNVFDYAVAELQVLQPEAVEEMLSGSWDLTLFTCTLGGQTRLTVRCTQTGALG